MSGTEFLSSVSPKGQITLPVEVRRQLGIKPKDKVAIRLIDRHVTIEPAASGFLAAYRSIPALATPLTDREMTEIAAEEAAERAVKCDLPRTDAHS